MEGCVMEVGVSRICDFCLEMLLELEREERKKYFGFYFIFVF